MMFLPQIVGPFLLWSTALARGLFISWIEEHLRIKAFFSTAENAVKSQVWIAVGAVTFSPMELRRLHVLPRDQGAVNRPSHQMCKADEKSHDAVKA
jgi:hypothetical protein